MKDGVVRAIIGVVALAVGVAIGWIAHARSAPAPGPPATPPRGKQVIVVGPGAGDVHPPEVAVSKQNKDVLFWVALDPKKRLTIESEQPLFEFQTPQQNGRFAMSCRKRMCWSDEILPTAANGRYKYWQILEEPGKPKDEADGWIIIDR